MDHSLRFAKTPREMAFLTRQTLCHLNVGRISQPNERTLVVSFTNAPFCKAQQNATTASGQTHLSKR